MPSVPAWLEPFPCEVREAILPVLEAGAQTRRVACFDADGTLWPEDIGEAFFRWLIAGAMLPHVDCSRNVYADYEARVHADRAAGYAWCVASMAGLAEADVARWTRQLAAAWPNYRPAMVELVRGLSDAGVETWLVSASNRWIVRAAAPHVGADPERVIAITTRVRDGRMTDEVIHPVICEAGKVEAIDAVIGQRPDLAFGDSLGDLQMLEAAVHPVVIGRHDRADADLVRIGRERGWAVHLF